MMAGNRLCNVLMLCSKGRTTLSGVRQWIPAELEIKQMTRIRVSPHALATGRSMYSAQGHQDGIELTTKAHNVVLNVDNCGGPCEHTVLIVLCSKWQRPDAMTKEVEIFCQSCFLRMNLVPKRLHLPSHFGYQPIKVA